MEERLQKIISACGLMSRRAAEDYIASGKVTVNGAVAQLGDKADIETDIIKCGGVPLRQAEKKVCVMLNKPRGYVTTMNDEKGRRDVTGLVKAAGTRIYPVGRLDMYSEGLLLLTNDGELANRIMHPKNQVSKTYRTWVSGEDIGFCAELLRGSMIIDDYEISPAEVEIENITGTNAILLITIHEGRNRQVRKMCEAVGLRVLRLCRISEGALELGDLKTGQWRYLSEEEIQLFR